MGATDVGLGQRLGNGGSVERLAQWWTQAAQEARFGLLQRVLGQKTPEKGDPSLFELKIAIYLAESEAGEIDQG